MMLPKGERAGDELAQTSRWSTLKFRLALAARKYPIQIAVLVALTVVTYPVVLLVEAQHQLEHAQQDLVAATKDIQASRKEAIRRACQEQNGRHDDTVKALTKGSSADEENAKTEAAKKEIRRRRDVTLALISALAPHEDCEARVKRLVPDGAVKIKAAG